jgi:AraC-like DNA-binding protein
LIQPHKVDNFGFMSVRQAIPNVDTFMSSRLEGMPAGVSVRSHLDGPIDPEVLANLARPHRTSFYFLLYVTKGIIRYSVDLQELEVREGEVLFVKPWQVRTPPPDKHGAEYSKVSFGAEVMARLSGRRFWLDPYGCPLVRLTPEVAGRLETTLTSLRNAVVGVSPAEVVWAYLNAVTAEVEAVYFADRASRNSGEGLGEFLRFQELIDARYAAHPSIGELTSALGLSGTGLYQLVKEWTGLSPKEYLNHRLVVEAQRYLLYEKLPVKELSSRLGFSDENYFSRFFRRQTGTSVSEFQAREFVQVK